MSGQEDHHHHHHHHHEHEHHEGGHHDHEHHHGEQHHGESHHTGGEHHDEHHENLITSSSSHHDEHGDFVQPSAPLPLNTTYENGYIVVPPTPQSSVIDSNVENVIDLLTQTKQEEIHKALSDLSSHVTEAASKLSGSDVAHKVVAEADSSNSKGELSEQQPKSAAPTADKKGAAAANGSCSICPYYLLAIDRLSKVEIPPKVKDLLLWRNPKLTGAIFGSSLVLLISIASLSLLTVVSSLFLIALTLIGAYRFYLAVIFRIKGTYDNTFDKLSAQDLSLPKDKVQNLAKLLETDFNRALQTLKSILLWDNITTSALAFVGFYIVYCVGCWFNTITLLILILVDVFTLPKIYDVYKQPIDKGIESATAAVHGVTKQVLAKIPMLNKKKTQ